jgi:hypothetical protein
VRVVGPLVLFAVPAFLSLTMVVAPEACVLAQRDPGGDDDSMAPPSPVEAGAPDALDECTCCGKTIEPLLPDCSGNVAVAIPAGDCPKDCKGSTAYLLCEGVCYSDCACDRPAHFLLADGGS